jgi:hypothetical protein
LIIDDLGMWKLPSETLCLDKPTRPTRRGFRDADFFGASSVASALDRCTGRDPDTLSPHHSMTDLPPCYRNTETQISLKERTCPIYARQVNNIGYVKCTSSKDKTGDAVDRPRRESSLSGLPSANFFDKNEGKLLHQEGRAKKWKLTLQGRTAGQDFSPAAIHAKPECLFRGIVSTLNLSFGVEFNGRF